MFYYIKGKLVFTDPTTAVIDCGGVGYKLAVSANTLAKLTKIGEEVCLYTHMSVREDAVELLGFYTTEEHAAFKLLITVSGIGPKGAMGVLSVMTPEKFALAVSTGDTKAIAKAPGVGAKTAARIVLELKDKVAKTLPAGGADEDAGDIDLFTDAPKNNIEEAVTALMVLGYTKAEAQAALKGVNAGLSLEEMITAALRKMALKF